jgi:putative membrane protein
MTGDTPDIPPPKLVGGDAQVELSSNRTSLSFERTRMSADRTLMSTVRTSLSLISFGFTIHEVFSRASNLFPHAEASGRRLGLSLLSLGILVLVMGLISHTLFDRELGARRRRLHDISLLRRAVEYRATPTYVAALCLLVIGLLALGRVAFQLF